MANDIRRPPGAQWLNGFGPSIDYGYKPSNDVFEQLRVLRRQFLPTISLDSSFTGKIPVGKFEGLFVVVPWYDFFNTYNDAVLEMIRVIKSVRGANFHFESFGNFGRGFLEETDQKSSMMLRAYEDAGDGNAVVLKAQTGLLYGTVPPDIAAVSCGGDEFPLGLYEFLQILLTHPKRFSESRRVLRAQCSGDRCKLFGKQFEDDDLSLDGHKMNRVPVVSNFSTVRGNSRPSRIVIEKIHMLASDRTGGTATAQLVGRNAA